jgi:hypothetical protein
MDLRWRPGICLVLWSKKLFSLLPGHSYANADTRHSTLTIRVGGCPTHFLIPSMCQSKRNEDPPWYARSHMAVHMARIVEGGLLARLGVWNLLSKSVLAMVDCHFSQSYCPMYLSIYITRRFRVLHKVSSRITWHTIGHFAKIFMIIFARINIYLNNIQFLIRLNDRKGLTRASFNTPTHRQWRFWLRYRAIFNSLSTFKWHYHIKCSRLNRIVKRIVEINQTVEKIEW